MRTMKKALLCFIILLTGFNINCQTGLSEVPDVVTLTGPGETICLFTDRNMYCANETIFFTASYFFDSQADSSLWSRVLYIELIKWNGTQLTHLKLKLDKSGASGSMKIPADLISGNYYLRAYTKWMRNFSPDVYAYRLVKIVNPFNKDIDPSPNGATDSAEYLLNMKPHVKTTMGIRCSTNKSQYKPGEEAEIDFFTDDQSIDTQNYCISVARVGLTDTSFLDVQPKSKVFQIDRAHIEYLPEIQGITISGKVIDKTSKAPQKNLLVYLSETANGEFYSVYQTRDYGEFVFSLPDLYGNHDFFIQSETPEPERSDFLIDNGFCSRPVLLPYIAFSLNENEKHLIRDMFVNMQLSEKFLPNPDSSKTMQAGYHKPVVFYGSGRHTYYTKKYIEMPNLQEFFIEIVNETYVVVNDANAEVKISGITAFSNYPPLIFLDNIPVGNNDRLLKLPLDKIERVDVTESPYMVGNMKYSGLISIYSKNKDFAGIDMNKNSMFFSFELFPDDGSGFTIGKPQNARIPDRRNLLYWNPDVQLSPGQKTTRSFYTSDDKGDYVVYIYRKNNTGDREVYGTSYFSVK